MSKVMVVAPLRLERWIPLKDVRRLIWRYLRQLDIKILQRVHNSKSVIQWEAESDRSDAAKDGSLERIQWMLRDCGFDWGERYTGIAIEWGHLGVFNWAMQNGEALSYQHIRAFFATSRFDMLYHNYPDVDRIIRSKTESLSILVGGKGLLDALQWLRSHEFPLRPDLIFSEATWGNQMRILEWMTSQGYAMENYVHLCRIAAVHNDTQLISWLRNHGAPWGNVTDGDTWHGSQVRDLVLLKWLHESGAPLQWRMIAYAAIEDDTPELMQWVHEVGEQNTVLDRAMIRRAAEHGALKILKWMHSVVSADGPTAFLSYGLIGKAARWGHLETLKWLRSIGAPLDANASSEALACGSVETLTWLRCEGAYESRANEETITEMIRAKRLKTM